MKSKAYRIEGVVYCSKCAEEFANIGPFAFLWLLLNKPINEDSYKICSRCGKNYGSIPAQEAEQRIARMLKGK